METGSSHFEGVNSSVSELASPSETSGVIPARWYGSFSTRMVSSGVAAPMSTGMPALRVAQGAELRGGEVHGDRIALLHHNRRRRP